MHIYQTIEGENAVKFCEETLKLDPAQFDLATVSRVEVYGSDLSDPGEDYCEFRVIDDKDKTLAVRREMGY